MAGFKLGLILWTVSISAWAQTNRYIVFFRDKNNNPYSIDQPQAFLSTKSISRRNHSSIAVNADDLPVTPAYVSQVKATGAKVFFTTKWMNALLIESTASTISAISLLPMVAKTEMVAPGKKLIGGRSKLVKQKNAGNADQVTYNQLEMLGLDTMHGNGIYGSGVMVSVLDGGFPGVNTAAPFQHIFTDGRLVMTRDYVTNSGNVYQFDKHGTEVFSVISAVLPGSFTGGAYKANYLLFVTEDVGSEYRIEEYNWLFAAEKADSAGTDIIQSSLGYNLFDDSQMDYKISDLDGKTAVVSKAASMARDRGIIVVVSAGNDGTNAWHYIAPPADADGILAVGAVEATEIKANFSSYGPTSDGRIKPDVVALGVNTSVIKPDGTLGTASGTSLAAPLITSLAAGLLSAYPELTPAELVHIMKLSASKGNAPNNQVGFGLPNYISVRNYLQSNKAGDEIFIFPNPMETSLKVAFKKLPEGQVDLTFYDSQGKLLANPVVTLDWLSNPLEISLSNLAAGSYFLKVKTTTLIKTFHFVKL